MKRRSIGYLIVCLSQFALLVWGFSIPVFGQKFERFSNAEGFNQNTITSIVQDKYGFIWLGTPNGLIRYDGYEFKTFTTQSETEGNIHSNFISSLCTDSQGVVWIGTDLGLNAYVPSLELFHTVPLPKKLHVNTISARSEGPVWFTGENELFVAKLNHKKDGVFSVSNNLLKSEPDIAIINSFGFLDSSSIVLATNQGLKKLNLITKPQLDFPEVESIITIESFKDEEVTNVLVQKGLFWISTTKGLYKATFEGDKVHVLEVYEDLGDMASADSEFAIMTIVEDNSGAIWIGTKEDGLFKYKNGSFKHFAYNPKDKSSLSSPHVNAIYQDDFDVFWVGTAQSGLNKLNLAQKQFTAYSHNPYDSRSLSDNLLMAILEDNKGKLWLSGYDKNLFRTTTSVTDTTVNTLRFETLEDKLNLEISDVVRSIYEDREGFIWFGTDYKVIVYNPKTKQYKQVYFTENGIPFHHSETRKIYQIDDENVLLTGSSIVVISNPWQVIQENVKPQIPVKSSVLLQSESVQSLVENEKGSFWFGTDKGLIHGNFDGESIKIDHNISEDATNGLKLSYRKVFTLETDDNGAIWIGTFGGGLNKMTLNEMGIPTQMEYFRKNDLLPDDAIYGILKKGNKHLWMSTDMGLVKLNVVDNTIDVFDVRDGLPQNNFRQGAYFKGASGFLYFGGLNGLTIIKPENIKLNEQAPKVLVTDLLVNNERVKIGEEQNNHVILQKSISETEHITINKTQQQSIAFNLAVEHTASPSKNRLAYKLENFSEDWIEESSGKTTVTFTNLAAGDYTFKVRAANGDGVWATDIKTLQVSILPPWYQTWWSYLLFIILVAGICVGIVVYFTQHEKLKQRLKFEKLDRQRQQTINQGKFRYFTNLSHEFRTPLTLISGPLEHILIQNKDPENRKYLEIIRKNTKRLLSLVDQLITFRQAEQGHLNLQLSKDTLGGFMYPTTEAFENYAQERDINFYFKVSSPDEEIIIDVEKTERIIFNLLSNSFKNTPPKGSISVESKITFDQGQKIIHIDVIDNGKGIPANDLDNIFERFYQLGNKFGNVSGGGIGLSFCKSLVNLLGGDISAMSNPGLETRFSVSLPSMTISEYGSLDIGQSEQSFIKDWIPLGAEITKTGNTVKEKVDTKDFSILIVENEEDVQTFLISTLSQKYNIDVANNGVEGLAKIKDKQPDLVISDVMMPEMDGFELCKKIKSDFDLSHISVLLLTALGGQEDLIKGLEFGADDYLSKPFSIRHLELRVNRLIQNKAKLRQYFTKNSEMPKEDIEISTRDKYFLEKVIAAIEENLSDSNFGVEELACQVGLSTSHFYRRLKQLTGQVPNVYLRNFRLQRAAELLRNNEGYNVTEVMYLIGIESNSYFSTSFKKLHGVSPSEFIKQKVV
ncbi:hybrid sensor histidine kinase/response regulator transcription factor [Allomuricauda sp. F6463D]|uniref:hybrid sensor histidine kinase/response regulator transcription factor n=1 Tax=Allomuricauda sp. F6463D TaxID=2926409 RepID=UPI001FF4ACA8|nr:hybrid sensor histidine kinase/response regulator transcription factor [Muricauda sp. F6463D]MCK0160530.1 response regulator [Muricauda sp. F6463D]